MSAVANLLTYLHCEFQLAKFTSLWLRWHELRDGILNTTHRAHRNYGPIVQLSPKMISFCHPDAIKDIYTGSRGGLDAIDLVWFFERYGSPNVRRQGREQPLSWTVDVFPMMRWLTADIMIGLIYGREKPLNLLSNPDSRAQMNELLTPTLELVASPLMTAFQWLPLPIMKLLSPLINPGSKLTTFGMSLVQESLKSLPPQSKDDDVSPRVVKTKDQDVTVMGLKINPGTIISIQPHALHRDPDTFPNPDVWDPERWQVPITSPAHRQMQRMLMPFGYGQRMCTGMNVAWAIMRQVTASIYREYETSLDEGVWFDADGELASKDVKHENRRRKKKNLFPDGGVQPIVFRRV
ncbi:predicted protein [Histoplasma mississippiense (nom. inval.)]|uniref:predicted protein n=1 Tax=Ajellomyces capsulatus (strain NAm1 / WU24) TaxID=2059318 RepID=UPI000157D043|nr:predicted protein [Histoplasma mississippiense (nom. inval.)]EDN10830.1 predicted protein [Histoplasma mississippiense (nom. inval.)]